jgi:hypothetical protein
MSMSEEGTNGNNMSSKNNDNVTTVTGGDDVEGPNNNIDRIAAIEESIAAIEEKIEETKKAIKTIRQQQDGEGGEAKKDQLINKLELKAEYKDSKEKLLAELRGGHYFAKADDIFPRDKYELINRSGFDGAADKMMRERAPGSDDVNDANGGFYDLIVKAFLKHLPEDGESESIADMNSVATSAASVYSEEVGISVTQGEIVTPDGGGRSSNTSASQNSKKKNLVRSHTIGSTQRGGQAQASPKPTADVKRCIIPSTKGHKAHLVPNAPTCAPWWPLVCLWAIGKVDRLKTFYEKIDSEDDPEKRKKLEKCLRDALVQLVLGTKGGSPGMKDNPRNLLFVPDSHADYYDTGYNWVIIPIMTLQEIKNWKGGSYEVAVFTGEHAEQTDLPEDEKLKNEKYNHFQDGPTKYSAVDAEKQLFAGFSDFVNTNDTEHITICSDEDLQKVTDALADFLKAFADLHTRSRNDDGTHVKSVSPRKRGIIDVAEGVRELAEEGTTKVTYDDSRNGIEALIARLSKKSSGSEVKCGIRIPKRPDTNCFSGKHVFKTSVRQAHPPDPMLVADKGVVNFGRQWGFRFMPGCPAASDSDSSTSCWSIHEKDILMRPRHSLRISQGLRLQS